MAQTVRKQTSIERRHAMALERLARAAGCLSAQCLAAFWSVCVRPQPMPLLSPVD
jgi:hypothetical protein